MTGKNTQATVPSTHLHLADIRTDYTRDVLLEDAVQSLEPFALFGAWMEQAVQAGLEDANAMTLSTVGSDLRPSSRVVLLKGLDAQGPVWFTNYHSRKGRELAGNPFAALQFHWVALQRVVRIEGRVEKVGAEESDLYFASRPLASRLGAWASPQSEAIANRAVLEARLAEVSQRPDADDPARPGHWGGYRLVPDRWEFWQGRASRLHDRLQFTRAQGQADGSGWKVQRLAP